MAEELDPEIAKQMGIGVDQPKTSQPPPIGFEQRLILQNIFDSQPERRAAYFKKLGYEMNPKDDNEYRAIGSTGDYAELDPGFIDILKKKSLTGYKEKFQKIVEETGRDISDVGLDLASGIATGGITMGAGPLAIPAFILSGAAGNAITEGVKYAVGEALLDENVPIDKSLLVTQSLMAGLVPALFKGGKRLSQEATDVWLKSRKDAIVNAAKASGGGLTEDIIDKAVKNPNDFTREAVSGASERLLRTYKSVFGADKPLQFKNPESMPKDGLFGKVMARENDLANAEIDRLANMRSADISIDDMSKPFVSKLLEFSNKAANVGLTDDEKSAYMSIKKYLGKLDNIRKGVVDKDISLPDGVKPGPREVLDFKTARKWLSDTQNEVLEKDALGQYVKPEGKIFGSILNKDDGLLKIVNDKAIDLKSQLPEINMRRSEILDAYNRTSQFLTPEKLTSAFVGKDKASKVMVREALGEISKRLKVDLVSDFETGAMQQVVEDLYKGSKNFGSGRVNAEIVRGGISKGIAGGLTGAGAGGMIGAPLGAGGLGFGLGAVTGAISGAAKGMSDAAVMSSPEAALNYIRKNATQRANIEDILSKPTQISSEAFGIGSAMGGEVGISGKEEPKQDLKPQTEEDDGLDPELKKAMGL